MKAWPLLLVLLAGCSGCVSIPTHGELRATTHRLNMASGVCGGTAIGPATLRTAAHCLDMGGPLQKVDLHAVTVVIVARKGKDWVDITLSAPIFKTWAHVGPPMHQGDRVRWWGVPMGESDMYRQGYVARADADLVVIDATICHGDSGSGIFNDAGQLVGVVTAMSDQNGCTFMLDLPA
jgi:V8-like Glu-specific endopeptidase